MHCLIDFPRWSAERMKSVGNGCLFAAAKALGAVGMEQAAGSGQTSAYVQRQYVDALRLLNEALSSPLYSTEDSTLAATMIVSAIELKVSPNRSIDHFINHINGATTMLQLRGPEQVTSNIGAALYLQVSSQLYMSCMVSGRAVPQAFRDLRGAAATYVSDPAAICWREHGVVLRFVDFMVTARATLSLTEPDVDSVRTLVLEALAIYDECSSMFETAPDTWQYESIPSESTFGIGYQHRYSNATAAQSWCGKRVTTLALFDVIIKALRSCADSSQIQWDPTEAMYIHNAESIIQQTGRDILADTPQQIGYMHSRMAQASDADARAAYDSFERSHIIHHNPFRQSSIEDPDLPYVVYMGGLQMHQALFLAANTETLEPQIRENFIYTLTHIGESMSLRQALVFADVLRARATHGPA